MLLDYETSSGLCKLSGGALFCPTEATGTKSRCAKVVYAHCSLVGRQLAFKAKPYRKGTLDS